MLQFCMLFYANYTILATQKRGHGPMPPPKYQSRSPRGHPWHRGLILKSLALASKVKSLALASKPQVLENFPVLGSRTALFFEQLKFRWKTPETLWKICQHLICFPHLEHWRSEGGDQGARPPHPIEISPKMRIVSSVSVLF